jgi:hypothetical protein
MSKDLRDNLLTWISRQEIQVKEQLLRHENPEFNQGRLITLVDIKVFIMTEGLLSEPSPVPTFSFK